MTNHEVSVVPTNEQIAAAIKATEYKYFGDYEMSDDQRDAVDVLVRAAQHYVSGPTAHQTPPATQPIATVGEVRKLKRQYPDYIDDPEGLARFRAEVERHNGHDMAATVNYNSLGRLLDTIERLRAERDAATLHTPPPVATATVVDAGEREAIERAIRATEYKYFGDYEMSGDQREAVDQLVLTAQRYLAVATPTPPAGCQ